MPKKVYHIMPGHLKNCCFWITTIFYTQWLNTYSEGIYLCFYLHIVIVIVLKLNKIKTLYGKQCGNKTIRYISVSLTCFNLIVLLSLSLKILLVSRIHNTSKKKNNYKLVWNLDVVKITSNNFIIFHILDLDCSMIVFLGLVLYGRMIR